MERAQKIAEFNKNYYVRIDSLATQPFSLDEEGNGWYGIADVYGDTALFNLYSSNRVVPFMHTIEKKNLDEEAEYLRLVDLFADVGYNTEAFENALVAESQ